MRRRRLLVSLLAGATVPPMTGCVEPIEEELLGVQAPEYTYWIPAMVTDDEGNIEFTYYDVDSISGQEGIGVGDFSGLSSYARIDSVSAQDVLTAVSIGTEEGELRTVATGGFDDEEIMNELLDEGFVETEEYDVYRILESEEDRRSFGVSVGALVESRVNVDEVTGMIDADNGDTERLVEADEDFRTLVNELETGTVVSGRLTDEGRFGEIASGERFDVEGETTDVFLIYIFENAVEADNSEGDVREESEDDPIRNVSIEFELSVVRVTGEIDTEVLRSG